MEKFDLEYIFLKSSIFVHWWRKFSFLGIGGEARGNIPKMKSPHLDEKHVLNLHPWGFAVRWWALSAIHALFCLFLCFKVVQVPTCRTVLDLALQFNIGQKSQLTCSKGEKFASNLQCLYLFYYYNYCWINFFTSLIILVSRSWFCPLLPVWCLSIHFLTKKKKKCKKFEAANKIF